MKLSASDTESWAIIVGGSSGIGKGLVERYLCRGNFVLVVGSSECHPDTMFDFDPTRLAFSGMVDYYRADLTNMTEVLSLGDKLSSDKRNFSDFVYCAGVGLADGFMDSCIADELRLHSVNTSAALILTHSVVSRVEPPQRIMLIGSTASLGTILPEQASYGASKSWISYFGLSLAKMLKPLSISVMVAVPGPTHTNFHERAGIALNDSVYESWRWSTVGTVADKCMKLIVRERPGVYVLDWRYRWLAKLSSVAALFGLSSSFDSFIRGRL